MSLLNFNHSHSCSSTATEWLQGLAGQGMVTHQSQLYTSVQIKTSGFPPFHAYEGTGIRSLVPFLACHLPSTLLGNRIWSPFAQGDGGLCPFLNLGNLFPHFPVSHRHLPTLPPECDWWLLLSPTTMGSFASAFHHDNIPEVRI